MPKNRTQEQAGIAMISGILVITMLFGVAAAYLSVSSQGVETNGRQLAQTRARFAAYEGLQRSMAELKEGVDVGGDGLGTISFLGSDEREVTSVATTLGGNLFRLHSVGKVTRGQAAWDMLVLRTPAASLNGNLRAAITSRSAVTTSGNIRIDGRNWNSDGTGVVGPGVFGVSSVSGITQSGSSTIGGNGYAPARPANAAAKDPNSTLRDLLDNDSDGSIDEELFDGIDNDGDGQVDEDTQGFPTTPDAFLRLTEGSLRAAAEASGTYFASQGDINSYLAAHGGEMPGGKIIYCDFSNWLPVDFGPALNDEPSIIVHHNSTGSAHMKNLHGAFKGLIIADNVQHLNGNFLLVGGFISFSSSAYGNTYGNGAAVVKYSSEVLGSLPGTSAVGNVRVVGSMRSSAN